MHCCIAIHYNGAERHVGVPLAPCQPFPSNGLRNQFFFILTSSGDVQETQTAFVVMKTRQARAHAAVGLLHTDGAAWKVKEAPAPNEVIWANISQPPVQEIVGSLLAWGALTTIIIFFIPIILFLQQIVNLVCSQPNPELLCPRAAAVQRLLVHGLSAEFYVLFPVARALRCLLQLHSMQESLCRLVCSMMHISLTLDAVSYSGSNCSMCHSKVK